MGDERWREGLVSRSPEGTDDLPPPTVGGFPPDGRVNATLGRLRGPNGASVGLLAATVLTGTALSTAVHYYYAQYLGRALYPWSTFLQLPSVRFTDFLNDVRWASDYSHHRSSDIAYTPFWHFMVGLVDTSQARAVLLALSLVFLVVLAWIVARYIADWSAGPAIGYQQVFILTALSYPVLFALDRGNSETMLFIFLAAFTYLYYVRASRWSMLFLALAIAMKLYPAVLLVVPLSDRKYRHTAAAGAGAAALLLVSTVVLGAETGRGAFGVLSDFADTLRRVNVGQYLNLIHVQHGHSLWGLIGLYVIRSGGQRGAALEQAASVYSVACVLIFAAVATYVIVVERAAWRRFALLLFCALLLPLSSHDYTSIQLYLVIALFVAAPFPSRYRTLYALLFGILLTPVDYVFLSGTDVSISVVVYPAVIVALMLMMVFEGFAERRGRGWTGAVQVGAATPVDDQNPSTTVSRK